MSWVLGPMCRLDLTMTKLLCALRALRYLIQKGGPEALSPGIKVTGIVLFKVVKLVQCFSPLRVEVDDQGMAVKAGFVRWH